MPVRGIEPREIALRISPHFTQRHVLFGEIPARRASQQNWPIPATQPSPSSGWCTPIAVTDRCDEGMDSTAGNGHRPAAVIGDTPSRCSRTGGEAGPGAGRTAAMKAAATERVRPVAGAPGRIHERHATLRVDTRCPWIRKRGGADQSNLVPAWPGSLAPT
jgi:hypothetical protein